MCSWIPVFATLLISIYVPGVQCGCDNATWLSMQVDALMAEYDRDSPPAPKVTVQLGLDVKHAAVDQDKSTMRLLADLRMTWEEPRIMWNASDWGCDSALTPYTRVWLPDVVLLNTASHSSEETSMRVRLDATGRINHVKRLDLSAPLALALDDWPRDTQACIFKFGSRTSNTDNLELQIYSDFKHAVVVESNTWEILGVTGFMAVWRRDDGAASVAKWEVRVARRAAALALGSGALLAATALLLLAATVLPPQQRAPLAACASFTAALWLSSALVRVPGAAACPRVLRVMCALCACGGASAVCAALVLRVARCSAPPPQRLRTMLSSLSALCRLTPQPETCSESESGAWAAAALLVDRACCAALLLTLLVLLAVLLF